MQRERICVFEHLGKRRRWRLGKRVGAAGRVQSLGGEGEAKGPENARREPGCGGRSRPPARMSLFQGRGTPLRQNQTVFLGAGCGGLPREPGLPWDVADGGRREGSGGWEGRREGEGLSRRQPHHRTDLLIHAARLPLPLPRATRPSLPGAQPWGWGGPSTCLPTNIIQSLHPCPCPHLSFPGQEPSSRTG